MAIIGPLIPTFCVTLYSKPHILTMCYLYANSALVSFSDSTLIKCPACSKRCVLEDLADLPRDYIMEERIRKVQCIQFWGTGLMSVMINTYDLIIIAQLTPCFPSIAC